MDQIREAGTQDWRAAAKFTELVAPEDFARQRVELSTAEPLKITLRLWEQAAERESEGSDYQSEVRKGAVLK